MKDNQRANKKSPAKQPPWEQGGDGEAVSFGTWLRRQREMREITLREISDASKISLRYLEALEEDRYDLLPAPVFAKGFLRQYARYVGLDPDEAVNRYLVSRGSAEAGDAGESEPGESTGSGLGGTAPSGDSGSGGAWKTALVAILVALVLLALVFLVPQWLEKNEETGAAGDPPPGVVPPAQVEAPPPPAEEPAPTERDVPLAVTLDFVADSWVEAVVDGAPQVSEMRVQGESLQLEAQESVELRLGNAGGVEIQVNGEPYDFGGQSGEVRTVRIGLENAGRDDRS